MPIKGLTDRNEVRFPRIGFVRKGSPKREKKRADGSTVTTWGVDLDHFRFDSDDDEAMAAFHDAYGDEPKQINVFLPWPDVDQNFQAWKEHYTAGALQHRCDGETCVLWLDKKDGTYHTDPIPCPGGCKEIGYLSVIIPELKRLAFVTVLTHSKHDIMELQANLEAYRVMTGQLRGIPFVLRRVEREISMFDEKSGKRVRRRKWLMHVETAPRWAKIMITNAEYSAIPAPVRAALPAPVEAQYVIEGFETQQRIEEIDRMSDGEKREMLQSNVSKMRGPNWEHFDGFGDEPLPPKQQPAPSGQTWQEVTDAEWNALPSASAERAAGNGKSTPAAPKHDPNRPWDDDRKAEAVRWAMKTYPGVYKHEKHAMNSLDNLIKEMSQDGTVDPLPSAIAQAWKDKVHGKHLDAQAAAEEQQPADEQPQF